jgi:hypothetical protein
VSRHEFPTSITVFTLTKQHASIPKPLTRQHFVGATENAIISSLNFHYKPVVLNGKRKRADADADAEAKADAPTPDAENTHARDVDAAILKLRCKNVDAAALDAASRKLKRFLNSASDVVESWSLNASAGGRGVNQNVPVATPTPTPAPAPTPTPLSGAPASHTPSTPAFSPTIAAPPSQSRLPGLVFGCLLRPGAPILAACIVNAFRGHDGMLTTRDLKTCNLPMGEHGRAAAALGVTPLRLYVSL